MTENHEVVELVCIGEVSLRSFPKLPDWDNVVDFEAVVAAVVAAVLTDLVTVQRTLSGDGPS